MTETNYTNGGLPYRVKGREDGTTTNVHLETLASISKRYEEGAHSFELYLEASEALVGFLSESYGTLSEFLKATSTSPRLSTMGWNYICKVVTYALNYKRNPDSERTKKLGQEALGSVHSGSFFSDPELSSEVISVRSSRLDSLFEELEMFGAELNTNHFFVAPLFGSPALLRQFIMKLF